MKKILKSALSVLFAAVMALGVYLPMSGVMLFDSFSVEAQAASIPAVPSDLDYNLIRCNDQLAYIAFSTLNGSYNYTIVLSNDDYGFSKTADTFSSSAKTMYVYFDLGKLAESSLDVSFSWTLKITTYSGNTKGGTRTWNGLIDHTCYSKYVPIDYYGIYFSYNDGSDNYFIQNWPGVCSGTTNITSRNPIRNGYNFLGWSTNSSATSPSYFAGDTVSYDHNRMSLYAVWAPNKYTVKYNANGGSGSMSSSTHTYDQNKTLSYNKFTRPGYDFLGWSTSSSATSATYSDGQSVKNLTSSDGATVNLYAVWSKIPTYTISYNANGGSGAPSSQTKTKDTTLWLSSTKPTKSYTVTYNANGGSVSPSSETVSCTFKNWNTAQNGSGTSYSSGASYTANSGATLYAQWTNPTYGTLPTPTRTEYNFDGWYTSASGGTKVSSSSTVSSNTTLYAHWTKSPTYTISYNANGGSGAPSSQTKTKDTTLWLSSTKPTKSYTVTYNANGGSVSPSSKTVSCTFKNWNTAQNGSGTSYSSGASYTANSGATLYAQWSNPTYGTLPTPTRTGYIFDGWYTSASNGMKVTSSSIVSSNSTLYAHWTQEEDVYNLGEETYSFSNYGDYDSPGGHCFGMSITSSAYYIGELDISLVGGNYEQDVYSLGSSNSVRAPICYYQDIQDSRRDMSMVAGGSLYKYGFNNIASDWTEVINYVENHNYDNKGTLQIGFRKDGEGGHAINFLYYAEVDGQPRIYAYDNNFPNTETYFYMDSNGKVRQAPLSTFSGAIDCITLRSVPQYFDLLDSYDSTRYIFADKDTISIEGATVYALEGGIEMGERVMYEVPANTNQVTIKPLVDNAEFEYLDESYSFGSVDDDMVGVFTLATSNDTGNIQPPGLTITKENKSFFDYIADFFKMILELLLFPFMLLF